MTTPRVNALFMTAPFKAILKRELMGYFRSPVAYVFIIIFLLATTGTTWYLGRFYDSNQASLESFFFFHPWLYLVFIPAVGMRLWAEERRSGSVELLFTLPVGLPAAVLAKFLASWLFVLIALLLTFPMILTTYYLGEPDGGVIFSGYVGSFLLAGAYLAIACFTSAITKNQVISFILSFLIGFVLVMMGWGVFTQTLLGLFPVWLTELIVSFSFISNFDGLRRGLLDLRELSYFLSMIAFMLFCNMVVLENQRGG